MISKVTVWRIGSDVMMLFGCYCLLAQMSRVGSKGVAGMNSLFPIRWYDSFTELSRLAQNSSEVRESESSSRLSLSPEPHYQLKPPRRRGHKRLCASSKEISFFHWVRERIPTVLNQECRWRREGSDTTPSSSRCLRPPGRRYRTRRFQQPLQYSKRKALAV
jgi:hypothetical protein